MTDAHFWDRIAPRYARQPISNPDAYEATLARVKTYLSESDTVLEIGCGTGSTALLLAPYVKTYEATDISQGMIDIAIEKAWNASAPNLTFRQAGVIADEYTGRTPDIVLAFNLLHLVPDAEATLAMLHDLLPQGGLFISKTPCIGTRWYFRPVVKVMQLVGKAPFVRFFKVPEFDDIIARAGFDIIETGLYPPTTPSRFVVARKR